MALPSMKLAVLVLADLVLDLVDGELGLELEEVVEHLHPAAGEVVEQVGVGAVLLVERVGSAKSFSSDSKSDSFTRFRRTLPLPEILVDAEGDEGGFEDVLVETVVAQRIHELDEVADLARIDDAQAVDIPPHGSLVS
jgi:hypothetical protein